MLDFLQGRASDRKLRLFACTCCRRIWHLFWHERSRAAIEVAERYADGFATAGELSESRIGAEEAWVAARRRPKSSKTAEYYQPDDAAAEAASAAVAPTVWLPAGVDRQADGAINAAGAAANASAAERVCAAAEVDSSIYLDGSDEDIWNTVREQEWALHCDLLRDFFGNPFRPLSLDQSSLTPAVVSLAQTIYDDRTFDRMPELVAALESAGCNDANILDHCRSVGPHVRGCWVVDLILGKK
jgi:hypothetical protein